MARQSRRKVSAAEMERIRKAVRRLSREGVGTRALPTPEAVQGALQDVTTARRVVAR